MRKVKVVIHVEDGHLWAEAPDIDGWYAAANDPLELSKMIESGLTFALGSPVEIERHYEVAVLVPRTAGSRASVNARAVPPSHAGPIVQSSRATTGGARKLAIA